MSVVRFKVDVTPYIEREILYGQNINDLVSFFMELIKLMNESRNFSIIVLPESLKNAFYSDARLKVILNDHILDLNSNIIFEPRSKNERCPLDCVCHDFNSTQSGEDFWDVPRRVINTLLAKEYPLMVDRLGRIVSKSKCDGCSNAVLCREEYDITPFSDFNSHFSEYLNQVEGKLSDLYKATGEVGIAHLKYASFVQAYFHGVSISDVKNINNIYATKGFIEDVQGVDSPEFKNIAFCMFRAISYPSTQDVQNRVKFSIDWHVNGIKHFDGFALDRCDVLPPNMTGHKASGASRFLMAKKDGKTYFIAYDPDHEFSKEMIKNRITQLKAEIENKDKD